MKTRKKIEALILAIAILVPALSHAQITMMERTPQLERLNGFIGTWHREAEPPPADRPGPTAATKIITWGPGDVWMTWEATIHFNTGQTVLGRRQIAWDARNKIYKSSWVDSQSAHVITSEARWTDSRTYTIICDPIPWHDGRAYRFKTEYKFLSESRIHETGWRSVDGGAFDQFQQAHWVKLEPDEL